MKNCICCGAEERFGEATEVAVRAEFFSQLALASNRSEKAAAEELIRIEIAKRLKETSSPQSLWSSF